MCSWDGKDKVENEKVPVRNVKLSNLSFAVLVVVFWVAGFAFAVTSILEEERSEKTNQDFGVSTDYHELRHVGDKSSQKLSKVPQTEWFERHHLVVCSE